MFSFAMQGLVVAFLLTDSREARMYCRYLMILCNATGGTWRPKMIMADFEQGIHSGIQQAFGGKTVSRKCWFHLMQSIARHLKSKGNIFHAYLLLSGKKLRRLSFFS